MISKDSSRSTTGISGSLHWRLPRRHSSTRTISDEQKDPKNLLTEVDTTAEQLIIETIEDELGDDFEDEEHAIFGEETGGDLEGDFEYLWIVDPFDGTTNFVKGIPHFGGNIAVATLDDGDLDELHAAVTYYSLRGEVWVAVQDERAYKFDSDGYDLVAEDSEPTEMSVTGTETIENCFNGVDFYVKETTGDFDYLGLWRYLVAYSQGTRLLGAAAPDIAFVADGVFDTVSVNCSGVKWFENRRFSSSRKSEISVRPRGLSVDSRSSQVIRQACTRHSRSTSLT